MVVTLVLHIDFYTYFVSGDHFEYRVYAYLLPLVFVTLIWSLDRSGMPVLRASSIAVTFILLSLPVQWTHWVVTKDLNTRKETHVMKVSVVSH